MLIARVAPPKCTVSRVASACRLFWHLDRTRARYFSNPPALTASNDEVQVKVRIGLDKHVNLAIQQPPRPEDNAPIILYLHRGTGNQPHSLPSTNELALGANAVVVRLDYRTSKEEPYPFPIHSVLAGYDWIRTNLLPSQYSSKGSSHIWERYAPRIGVCGELVGGSLATMLALTECHGERIGAIKAAAVSNPIVDWTALVDPQEDLVGSKTTRTAPRSNKAKLSTLKDSNDNSHNTLSRNALLSLRSQYFRKPEKYFDAFASPLLFFRTPRYAVPGPVVMDPAEAEYASPDEEPEPELVKKRLSHRNYPPAGSGLVLPRMRLEVGEQSVLRGQGMEMVDLWRRSQTKHRDSLLDAKENVLEDLVREGSGLWGESELGEVGRWLGEALRK